MSVDKALTITVAAVDKNTKALFTGLAQDAKTAGAAMESAGRQGQQGLAQIGAAARSSAQSMDLVKEHAGALAGVITGSLIDGFRAISAAGQENAQAQRLLQTAIENTGQAWSTYSDRIEKATAGAAKFGVSDDAATNALSNLTTITGSASSALDLLQVTLDLAAAKHIDLASASNLVGRAFEGQTSMLTRYGIVLQAGATGTEAITELQAKFGGSAAANATILSQYTARLQDWEGKLGESIGPLSGVITLLPGLAAGYKIVGGAGGLVVDLFRAQSVAAEEAAAALALESTAATEAGVASEAAAVAEGGLLAAMTGPAGLIVGGVALAAGIGYLISRHHDQDEAIQHVTLSMDDLISAYNALAGTNLGSGAETQLFGIRTEAGQLQDQFNAAGDSVNALQKQLDDLREAGGRAVQGQGFDVKTGLTAQQIDAQAAAVQQQIDAAKALIGTNADLKTAFQTTVDVESHLRDSGVDTTRVTNELAAAYSKYEQSVAAGHPNFVQLETDVQTVRDGMYAQTQAATDATDVYNKLGALMQSTWAGAVDPLKNVNAELTDIFSSGAQAAFGFQEQAKAALAAFKAAIDSGDPTQIAAAYKALGSSVETIWFGLADATTKEATAADLASISNANMNSVLDLQAIAAGGTADALDKLSASAGNASGSVGNFDDVIHATDLRTRTLTQHLKDLHDIAAGYQESDFSLHGDYQTESDVPKAILNAYDSAHASQNPTSIYTTSGADLDAFAAKAKADFAAATQAAEGYIKAAGQMPSMVDVLAVRQQQGQGPQPTAALPGPDQQTLTSLINVKGLYGQIDDALKNGTITQDQYNLAQQTFDAIMGHTGETAKNLVGTLINVKGQYGVIDDLLAQGAITQDQWNDLQKVGNDVMSQKAQVDFSVIAGMQQSTQTLGDMTRVVIDNTDSIAQGSDKLKKWADDLIAAPGTIGKVDTLLAHHTITLDEYNQAQQAQISISETNAKVQEDVQTIQAKQAPLLAQLADQQEKYLAQISGLPAAQQLAALGFMDTTESMKAQNLTALAASAAMGQLGESGKASAAKIIQGAAEADPALESMLESMGLISMGADGTITVNFPAGQSVQDAIDGLQTSIDDLVGLEYTIAVGGDLSAYWTAIHGVDGQVVGTSYIQVVTIDGSTVTGIGPHMLGGVVQAHAAGGVATRLAEAGPELLDFPGGGSALAMRNAVYSVPEGTYVHTAPATKAMGKSGGAPQNFYGPLILQAASGDLHAELNRSAITRNRRA